MLTDRQDREVWMGKSVTLRSVAVELTARCNQRCAYCYNAWRDDGGAAVGQLPLETLKTTLTRLLDEAQIGHVTFTGGEPFMRREIFGLIDLVNAAGVGVFIISNGGLISEAIAEQLSSRRVRGVQVTIAGADEATHDRLCGEGTHHKALAAIRRLRRHGVAVMGSYLCTSQNFEQTERLFRQFAELGVRHLAFNRYNPSGFSVAAMRELMPTRSQVIHALGQADRMAAQYGLAVTNTMPIPPCVVDYREFPKIRFGQCHAGHRDGEVAIGPDGALKLCTLQKTAVGSILQTPLVELLRREAVSAFRKQIPTFCADCPHQSTCLGGCGAAAEWAFGRPDELDPFLAQHVMAGYRQRLAGGDGPTIRSTSENTLTITEEGGAA